MRFASILEEIGLGVCLHPEKHLTLSHWQWILYPKDHTPQKAIRAVYDCRRCYGMTVKYLFETDECEEFASLHADRQAATHMCQSFDVDTKKNM